MIESFSLLKEVNSYLKDMQTEWHFCGGWAIDLFIGEKTREHKDIDITVFRTQKNQCINFFLEKQWLLEIPTKNGFISLKSPDSMSDENNYFWCINPKYDMDYIKITINEEGQRIFKYDRKSQSQFDYIEVLFNKNDGESFVYRRNNNIRLAMDRAVYKRNEFSFLAPEIVLLYKSKTINDDNIHDFYTALKFLNAEQKTWLKDALTMEYKEKHLWLKDL